MISIYKFNVPGHCEGKIQQILNVQLQYGHPVAYVIFNDQVQTERALDFYTVRTGWELTGNDEEILKNSVYIGTVKDQEGKMLHCFAVVANPTNKEEDAEAANASVEPSDAEEVTSEPVG